MKSETIVIVDSPEIIMADCKKASDILLNFYRALGWNGKDILDPCKIRTTKAVYNNLYDLMYDKCPDPVGVGMLMVNRGPGTENHIPPGKIYLYDGWVTPVELMEGANENGYQQQAV